MFTGIAKYIDKRNWLIAFFIFVFFCIYYFFILFTKVPTDIQPHIMASYDFVNAKAPLVPNFLYFILVALFAGFSKYKILYYISSILLLAFALSLKYTATTFYIKKLNKGSGVASNKISWLSIALLFVFCLPGVDFFKNNLYYLGQLAPNVWHNSTVIFLFPFAIILFFESYRLIEEYTLRRWVITLALVIINIMIKPSFVFTIIPALFIKLLFTEKEKRKKIALPILLLCFISVCIVFLQYFIIYLTKEHGANDCKDCSESIGIDPFAVWRFYSSSISISFITSLLFPILCTVLTKGQIIKNNMVKFAAINWVIAIVIFLLFVETGERKFHGNFGWQLIIANHLLFLTMAAQLFLNSKVGEITIGKRKILVGAFALHALWGVWYFLKIIIFKDYT